jgi:hypothetical protein
MNAALQPFLMQSLVYRACRRKNNKMGREQRSKKRQLMFKNILTAINVFPVKKVLGWIGSNAAGPK